jgi:hypothetical protein
MCALELRALGQLEGAHRCRYKRRRARRNHLGSAKEWSASDSRPHGRLRRRGRLSLKLLGSSNELALIARSDAALVIKISAPRQLAEHV